MSRHDRTRVRPEATLLIKTACIGVVCLAATVPLLAADSTADHEQGKYLIELSCDPSQQSAIAATLRLALALREDNSQVTLFVDLDAVQLATSAAHTPNKSQPPRDSERRQTNRLFERVHAAGVTIIVCPHCAERFHVPATELRDGMRFTSKDELETLRRQADKVFEYPNPSASQDDQRERDEPVLGESIET